MAALCGKKNNVDKTKPLVSKHQTHKHIRHFIRTPNNRVKIDISWVLMQNTVRVCWPTLILYALYYLYNSILSLSIVHYLTPQSFLISCFPSILHIPFFKKIYFLHNTHAPYLLHHGFVFISKVIDLNPLRQAAARRLNPQSSPTACSWITFTASLYCNHVCVCFSSAGIVQKCAKPRIVGILMCAESSTFSDR